jgi:hypothetical protein
VVMEGNQPEDCGAASAGEGAAVSAVPVHIAVDDYLESREGTTFLRLVSSGFLTTAAGMASTKEPGWVGGCIWRVYLDAPSCPLGAAPGGNLPSISSFQLCGDPGRGGVVETQGTRRAAGGDTTR